MASEKFKFNKSIMAQVRELTKGYSKQRGKPWSFVVDGSIRDFTSSEKILLYATGEINDLDIQEFDIDLFKSAINLNDESMIQKLMNLLPGKDKYTYTANKKEVVEKKPVKPVKKAPVKATIKSAPTKTIKKHH